MKHKTKVIFILSLILILIVVLFSYLLSSKKILLNISSNANIENPQIKLNVKNNTKQVYDYRLEKYDGRDDRYLLDAYNEKIAVESVNKLCGAVIMEYVNDNINQIFILQDINYGSDRPPRNLYKINIKDLTCRKLKISSQIGDFGGYRISPDQTKLALSTETNPKIIKVLNLINDTSKIVATAKAGETFNAGWGALSNKFVIDWLDNETLKFDKFKDVPKSQATSEGLKPIITTQVIKIK